MEVKTLLRNIMTQETISDLSNKTEVTEDISTKTAKWSIHYSVTQEEAKQIQGFLGYEWTEFGFRNFKQLPNLTQWETILLH